MTAGNIDPDSEARSNASTIRKKSSKDFAIGVV